MAVEFGSSDLVHLTISNLYISGITLNFKQSVYILLHKSHITSLIFWLYLGYHRNAGEMTS